MYKIIQYLAIIFFVVTMICSIIQWTSKHVNAPRDTHFTEKYNSELGRLNTISKLITYTDSLALVRNVNAEKMDKDYVDLLSEVIEYRFYHASAEYDFGDNYIAYLMGELMWTNFKILVIPEEIIQRNKGICNQQELVFQEALKRKEYKVRSILLPEHFCTEVYYDSSWHFYDTDIEPNFDRSLSRPSVQKFLNDSTLILEVYKGRFSYTWPETPIDTTNYKETFDINRLLYSEINEYPAKHMKWFHLITNFLSNFVWLFFLIIAIVVQLMRNSRKKIS